MNCFFLIFLKVDKELHSTKSPPKGWSYRFIVVTDERRWYFAASSSAEREAWYFSILNCCGRDESGGNSGGGGSGGTSTSDVSSLVVPSTHSSGESKSNSSSHALPISMVGVSSSSSSSSTSSTSCDLNPPSLSEQLQLQGGLNSIKSLNQAVEMALMEIEHPTETGNDSDDDENDDGGSSTMYDRQNLLRVFETCDAELVLTMLDTSTRDGGMFVEERERAKRMVTQYAKANDVFMESWRVYLKTAQDRFDYDIKNMAETFETARRRRGGQRDGGGGGGGSGGELRNEARGKVRNVPTSSTSSLLDVPRNGKQQQHEKVDSNMSIGSIPPELPPRAGSDLKGENKEEEQSAPAPAPAPAAAPAAPARQAHAALTQCTTEAAGRVVPAPSAAAAAVMVGVGRRYSLDPLR